MALIIRDREVEELARELARLTGKTVVEAVRDARRKETGSKELAGYV
jgi:hypothetical protein